MVDKSLTTEADEVRDAYDRQAARWQSIHYRSWMPGNVFIHQEAERVWTELLRRNGFLPLGERKVLDVGCGPGKLLIRMLQLGAEPANLFGIDLLEEQIARARSLAPHFDFRVADATDLPFDDDAFDLALAFTMFSSMRSDEARQRAANEIRRVLKPGGALLWSDFWINPVNDEVHPLRMKDIRRLFPDSEIDARRVTLLPPVARRVARVSWLACAVLDAIPFLRTHWLALIQPNAPR